MVKSYLFAAALLAIAISPWCIALIRATAAIIAYTGGIK